MGGVLPHQFHVIVGHLSIHARPTAKGDKKFNFFTGINHRRDGSVREDADPVKVKPPDEKVSPGGQKIKADRFKPAISACSSRDRRRRWRHPLHISHARAR
jgi:hypothetical protein